MTSRQKCIVGVLAVANGAVILALVVVLTRLSPATSATSLPSSVPPGPSDACERRVVQLLSQAGLSGTAGFISGETLRLDLVYPIPQDQAAEEAAQQVWTAFDIATALSQGQCGDFFHVTVVVETQGAQNSLRIRADVDRTDLEAFQNGELSESDFIDRVHYEAQSADG
jgi:hypothetical protein